MQCFAAETIIHQLCFNEDLFLNLELLFTPLFGWRMLYLTFEYGVLKTFIK